MSRLGRRATAVVAAAVLALGACGGEDSVVVAPVAVDAALVPAALDGTPGAGAVRLFENVDDVTRDAFANAGDQSLMADGRLWELRRAERLVGTLQLTTLLPEVDLLDESRRGAIVRGVMSGAVTRIRVDDVEVHTLELQDRAQYVWFGQDLVQVLTVRAEGDIVPEEVLRAVLAHQRTEPGWNPLPVTVEERSTES